MWNNLWDEHWTYYAHLFKKEEEKKTQFALGSEHWTHHDNDIEIMNPVNDALARLLGGLMNCNLLLLILNMWEILCCLMYVRWCEWAFHAIKWCIK